MVTIIVEDEWNCIADATAKFKTAPNFSRSSWDWIGLYKVGFKHHKDYVGYVWAKQEEADYLRQEHQVTFTEEELPKGSGDFILGYYSNNMSTVVGVTEPFQIQLPTVGPDHSSSDSSDFSSEEDSTVVLVKTGSQSPSPRRSKHRSHRSRSGSSSPEQAKVKAASRPADDASPADAPERESTGCPPEGSSSIQASDPQAEAKESEAKESGP